MKSLSIILIILSISGSSLAGDALTLGFFQAEPHILYDRASHKLSGALYTFLEEKVGPEMGVRFAWAASPFNLSRQLKMLETGKIDAVALLVWTKERAQKYLFTKNAFAVAKPAIGVLKTSGLTRVEGVDDLLHLKIGYVGGFYVSPFMRDPRLAFDLVFSGEPNEQNLKKLKSGRIDAVYIPDKAALLFELRQFSMENLVRVVELPEPSVRLHVVFSRANKAMADRYDNAYDAMDGDRVYRGLLGQYVNINAL